jgi:hypothetical protein
MMWCGKQIVADERKNTHMCVCVVKN